MPRFQSQSLLAVVNSSHGSDPAWSLKDFCKQIYLQAARDPQKALTAASMDRASRNSFARLKTAYACGFSARTASITARVTF
jgi:hypothetical protein